MECPGCKRANPNGAEKCECGYIFTAAVGQSSVPQRNKFAIASFVCGLAALLVPAFIHAAVGDVLPVFNPEPVPLSSQIAILCLEALPGVAAVLLGWEGGARVRETGSGRGLAIAGIVLGFVVLFANVEQIAELIRHS
jgi:hypothetical protein